MAAGAYQEIWKYAWTLDLLIYCQKRKKSADNAPTWHTSPFSILTYSHTTAYGKCSVHLVEDSPQLLSLLRNYIKLYTHKYISLTVPNLAKLKAKINIPLSLIIKK